MSKNLYIFATHYYKTHAYEARKYTEIQGSGGGYFLKPTALLLPALFPLFPLF